MKKLLYTLLSVTIIFSSCEKEEESSSNNNSNNNSNNTTPSIGDFYQGGVVFYLDGSGGGLICDIEDIASTLNQVRWGCINDGISGASSTNIGSGFSNSTAIVNGCNEVGIAAELCYNLTKAGYSDWYLPSQDELNEMYINKSLINSTSLSNGGYGLNISDDDDEYWSSSQGGYYDEEIGEYIQLSEYGFIQRFGDGHQKTWSKDNLACARAIRKF
jgi:hypothetical protein